MMMTPHVPFTHSKRRILLIGIGGLEGCFVMILMGDEA